MNKLVRLIDIEDVKLKTFSVEIKALSITGKQMTLSVFRQLPRENIFDENYSLRGIPWGTVNYYWKGNEGDIHIVWQRDNVLYRDVLFSADEIGNRFPLYKEIQEAKWNTQTEEYNLSSLIRGEAEFVEKLKRFSGTSWPDTYITSLNEGLSQQKKWIQEKQEKINGLKDFVKNNTEKMLKHWEVYKARYADLEQLPQLFIAM